MADKKSEEWAAPSLNEVPHTTTYTRRLNFARHRQKPPTRSSARCRGLSSYKIESTQPHFPLRPPLTISLHTQGIETLPPVERRAGLPCPSRSSTYRSRCSSSDSTQRRWSARRRAHEERLHQSQKRCRTDFEARTEAQVVRKAGKSSNISIDRLFRPSVPKNGIRMLIKFEPTILFRAEKIRNIPETYE